MSFSRCSRCAARSHRIGRAWLAAAGLLLALGIGGFAGQAAAIAFGAIVGVTFGERSPVPSLSLPVRRRRSLAVACLATLGALLLGLLLEDVTDVHAVALVDAMVRSGTPCSAAAVVLPLLDQALVEPGWSPSRSSRATGWPVAMPGPLFTFSAYLGAIETLPRTASRAPAWRWSRSTCRRSSSSAASCRSGRRSEATLGVQAALVGVTAAVVGVLAAAFWDPILDGVRSTRVTSSSRSRCSACCA